jgi:hypothetical protein
MIHPGALLAEAIERRQRDVERLSRGHGKQSADAALHEEALRDLEHLKGLARRLSVDVNVVNQWARFWDDAIKFFSEGLDARLGHDPAGDFDYFARLKLALEPMVDGKFMNSPQTLDMIDNLIEDFFEAKRRLRLANVEIPRRLRRSWDQLDHAVRDRRSFLRDL